MTIRCHPTLSSLHVLPELPPALLQLRVFAIVGLTFLILSGLYILVWVGVEVTLADGCRSGNGCRRPAAVSMVAVEPAVPPGHAQPGGWNQNPMLQAPQFPQAHVR